MIHQEQQLLVACYGAWPPGGANERAILALARAALVIAYYLLR